MKPAPRPSAPAANGGPAPLNPLTQTLIEHLSNEIEAQVVAMTAWRTRVNFTAFFGPWIIVGAYAALENVTPCAPDLSEPGVVASLVGLVAIYLLFGQGCAAVERGAWRQCNDWRRLIAELHAGDRTTVQPHELAFPERLRKSYILVYLLMALAFWAGTYLIGRCTQIPPTPSTTHVTPQPRPPDPVAPDRN